MTEPEPIIGIDLGTTNSLVAIAGWPEAGEPPRVLADADGWTILPSVVRFEPGGGVVVGEDARVRAVEFPAETVSSVKRLMGRSIDDAAADLPYLHYAVVRGEQNTARVQLPHGKVVSPQEVSAIILRRLKEIAVASLGVGVRKAVVTVPAYFDDAQRHATRDAARLAGLEVVRMVNEPTAAALAYGLGVGPAAREPRTVAVYDLGGGTFDVSILRITPSESPDDPASAAAFQVLSTAGDTHLGGDDLDHAIVALITREIDERFGNTGGTPVPPAAHTGGPPAPPGTLSFPPATRRALSEFARAAKERLSEREEANLRIDLGGGRVYERTISRDEFEALAAPLVDKTLAACAGALRDAKRQMAGAPIDAVVMVGGSTRVPLVREMVAGFFGLAPYTALDPDRVVALGAAVQGSIMSGAKRDALLLDVVPLSLGIETIGGAAAKLVMRNSTVPVRATERFSTSVDGQTSIKLSVLQGEREMAADCRLLGEFTLSGIPPMPAGIPKLLVTFDVDVSGILNVWAIEERSGKRASLQVAPNHGLTRDEVERMERESFAHAREDMTRHRVVDLVANAKLDIHWITRQLGRVQDKLGLGYSLELRAKIDALRGLVERAEADWSSVDADELAAAKEQLEHASVRLHEVSIAESLRGEGTV